MTSHPGLVTTCVLALVLGALGAVDRFGPEVVRPSPPEAAGTSVVPRSGSVVCAVGHAATAATTSVAVAGVGPGGQPAAVELAVFEEGAIENRPLPPVFAGAMSRPPVQVGARGAVELQWRDSPVSLSRSWVLDEEGDQPAVAIEGPCPTSSADRWVVPGLSTVGGDESRIRLANPHRTPATVAVSFLSPQGQDAPLILRNVSVPARSVREITVNDTLPERPDLAAVVDVVSGRLVVEGYQLTRSAIGGIDGGTLLAAAPTAAEEWTIPWIRTSDGTSSWLWIANPGDRTALVELTLHTTSGGQIPDGLAEVSVPPGEQRRVDLSGTLPGGQTDAGLTARSNGAPVVVSAATAVSAEDPADTGSIVQLGVTAADRSWVLASGLPGADRAERLHVVNPTGAEATFDVELVVGVTSLQPDELRGLVVGPGASLQVDLGPHVSSAPSWSAFVRASSGEVVVGRRGLRVSGVEGPLRLVVVPGAPSAGWRAVPSGLVARLEEDLANRFGTADAYPGGRVEAPGSSG